MIIRNWKYNIGFYFTYVVTFIGVFYFFVWLYIIIWCPFILAWRTPFNISCRTGRLTTNSPVFCLSRSVLIPLFLKGTFALYRNLHWPFFLSCLPSEIPIRPTLVCLMVYHRSCRLLMFLSSFFFLFLRLIISVGLSSSSQILVAVQIF